MDVDLIEALRTPAGEAALAAAAGAVGDGPLAAASALRAAGIPAELASAALTQAALRIAATAKFGDDAHRMYFTRAGLEQATRAPVAARRAARLAGTGAARIADLGCGIGADTLAFARAGLTVTALEADPATAAIARANATALGLADHVTVHCGDATAADLSEVDAVFCDPARRDGARRTFDPAQFSPPWSFVIGLADRVPITTLKLSPGLDHALIPPAAEAEWVSVDGDLVEAAHWFGPHATVRRRATVLRGGGAREHGLTGTGDRAAAVTGVRSYLFDPDPAVVRAHLVAEFADTVGGGLADPHIAYVFADAPAPTPYAPCFEVMAELPFARKRLRTALRERGIGRLEIRKRGLAVDPDELRRDLRLGGDAGATLVLLRAGDRPRALLCRPA